MSPSPFAKRWQAAPAVVLPYWSRRHRAVRFEPGPVEVDLERLREAARERYPMYFGEGLI